MTSASFAADLAQPHGLAGILQMLQMMEPVSLPASEYQPGKLTPRQLCALWVFDIGTGERRGGSPGRRE